MKPKLTVNRTMLLRLSTDVGDTCEQERQAEQVLEEALDETLEEIRAFAARKLTGLGQLNVTTF